MWTRIITALVLAPLFLLALFKLPVAGLLGFLGAILAGVAWEASALIGFRKPAARWFYVASILSIGLAGLLLMPASAAMDQWVFASGAIALVWWLVHIVQLYRFSVEHPGWYGTVFGRMLNIAFVLLTTWVAVTALILHDPREPLLLVYILVMIWIADSGAYFAGKFLGAHKLAVRVSPGKTIEGVIGGVAAVAIYAVLYGKLAFDLGGMQLTCWVLLAIVIAVISVAGDLNESALKRVMGKKDSGHIIPGHGGLFDRVDAITAAVPVFYFGWRLLDWGVAS